jgi:multidrug resistance protein, MATE family
MLMALLGYWMIGLPAAYLLGFHTRLGPTGVWVGLCIALAAAAILLAMRVRAVLWRGTVAAAVPVRVALPLTTDTAAPAALEG